MSGRRWWRRGVVPADKAPYGPVASSGGGRLLDGVQNRPRSRQSWARRMCGRRRRLGRRRAWGRERGGARVGGPTRIQAVAKIGRRQKLGWRGRRCREDAVRSGWWSRARGRRQGVDGAKIERALVVVEDNMVTGLNRSRIRGVCLSVGKGCSGYSTGWRGTEVPVVQVGVVQVGWPPKAQRARGRLSGAGGKRSLLRSRGASSRV